MAPRASCEPGRVTIPNSHSSEQGTLPTTSLISKQVVPYRTRGSTCCPGLSTSMTRSLADSSMTNHKLWRSQPSPPFQTLLKPQHQISPQCDRTTSEMRGPSSRIWIGWFSMKREFMQTHIWSIQSIISLKIKLLHFSLKITRMRSRRFFKR
jgi:hypothetical protein